VGEPVRCPAHGLDQDPHTGVGAAQGQRRGRQPDRDRGCRGPAGSRQRERYPLRRRGHGVRDRSDGDRRAHVASSYPYDSRSGGALSLRDNADEITERLSAASTAPVGPAGVQIIETRLTWLSYPPENAQAMLRRQQANAVVGARQRIVDGAVGTVRLAPQPLAEEDIVDLDEERKRNGIQSVRGSVQRTSYAAGREHRLAVPVTTRTEFQ
jgi:SPFH domain / Band 7 family